MKQRFRRERNLAHLHIKKTKPTTTKADIKDKIRDNIGEPLVGSFLKSYKTMQGNIAWRNLALLVVVSLILLVTAASVLPRVFSFQLDVTSIVAKLIPAPAITAEEEKNGINLLILWRGGLENDAPDLTDSIILAHYGAGDDVSFTTISIPRDLYIKSSELGHVKINEVYSTTKRIHDEETAFKAIMDVVSEITGQEINYYFMMDFNGFKSLVDHIGGVEIDVPERLYDNEYPTKNWWYTIVDIPVGLQHFDGDKALKYARSRHTTSDFDRSRRQQLVIEAIREKLLTANILTSPKKLEWIYNVIMDSIKTNMTLGHLIQLGKKAKSLDKKNIHGFALDNSCYEALRLCHPGGLLYTPDRELFWGASVLLPKKATPSNINAYSTIRTFVQIVTTSPDISNQQPLGVVNASGATFLASSVAIKLHSIGFPITEKEIKNQKEKVEKTFLRYNSTIIQPNNPLLEWLSLIFYGEKKPATPEELANMTTPYELVLGSDASLYFK